MHLVTFVRRTTWCHRLSALSRLYALFSDRQIDNSAPDTFVPGKLPRTYSQTNHCYSVTFDNEHGSLSFAETFSLRRHRLLFVIPICLNSCCCSDDLLFCLLSYNVPTLLAQRARDSSRDDVFRQDRTTSPIFPAVFFGRRFNVAEQSGSPPLTHLLRREIFLSVLRTPEDSRRHFVTRFL